VLRDIFAYLRSAAGSGAATEESGRYRVVDLSGLFTADNRMGLYSSQANRDNYLPFVRLGRVTANGVPFESADPAVERDGRGNAQRVSGFARRGVLGESVRT
jgi:hypothetical protein